MDHIAPDAQISEYPLTADRLLALQPDDDSGFERLARIAFEAQVRNSPTYRVFAEEAVWTGWKSVPFLPVEAFKWGGTTAVSEEEADVVFRSSGTGGRRSVHPIAGIDLFETLAISWFQACFGGGPFRFLAHLPTYEALGSESSLIYMVRVLIRRFGTAESLLTPDAARLRESVVSASGRTILFGTAFGLLDMIDEAPLPLPDGAIVIETGGMKSRRKETDRATLHSRLADGFSVPRTSVRSEYGMCEMVSQFYTMGDEGFRIPPWVRARLVDPDDPTKGVGPGGVGLLAVFDLGNIHSVSPLLTRDLARSTESGVEILGRVEGAELRGCNFLFEREL